MYNAANCDSMQFVQVSLTQDAFLPPGGVGTASVYNSLKDNFKDMRTDVQDVGDEAFNTTGGIYIMADGYYIQIGAGNTSNDVVRNRLIEAGKIAVAKLKRWSKAQQEKRACLPFVLYDLSLVSNYNSNKFNWLQI
jgi:hypothetical protein